MQTSPLDSTPHVSSQRINYLSPQFFHHPNMVLFLKAIGLTLIAVSILYLLAANWWMLPKVVQLAIPQLCLLFSACASVFWTQHHRLQQCLDGISGLMLGLSLAVIGQVYQTGADSYLLFLIWSILLLPWLYRPNIAVFCLLCMTCQFALYLYFKQTFLMQTFGFAVYLFVANIILALCFFYSIRHYTALRYIFIAVIACISFISMFQFCEDYEWYYLGLSLLLPIITCSYFYFKSKGLETSLQVTGLAASLSLLIFNWVSDSIFDSSGGFVFLALLIFLWFAAVSAVLMKLFPNTTFTVIPLAMGAWLAGIILSSLFLTFWKAISIFLGICFVAIAWFLVAQARNVFYRQFAYCLWICGQTAVLVHSEILTGSYALLFILQLVFLALSLILRLHWFIVWIQLAVSYVLLLVWLDSSRWFDLSDMFSHIILLTNYILLIVLLWTMPKWMASSYSSSFLYWMLLIVMSSVGLLGFRELYQADDSLFYLSYVGYALALVWLLSYLYFSAYTQSISSAEKFIVCMVGCVFIALGYFEIFLLLAIASWAIVTQHRVVQGMCVLLFIFLLWLLYYQLGLSFLVKSLTIFASGLVVLILSSMLQKLSTGLARG